METKICTICGEEKAIERFSFKRGNIRQSSCKECQRSRYDSSYHKAHNLRTRYGISLEDYERMLAQQEGRCAICRAEPGARSLAVDHCEDTGAIRGLLCMSCNQAIGAFDHNPVILRNAAEYLQKSLQQQEAAACSVKQLLQKLKQ